MSTSLIIDPGHGGTDPGTSGFGVLEKDWNLKMSVYQYNRLKALGANVAITRTNDTTLSNSNRTALIRNKYNYCMSNHFNGFNGQARGVETIHSRHASPKIATQLARAIIDESKLPLRRVFARKHPTRANRDYYFMHRETGNTRTIIVEYGFMDNKQDHDFYKNGTNFYRVAERLVKEWCQILGVNYVAPGATEKTDTLYRVQVGAFSNKENAEQLAKELKAKGYDTYITE